MEMETVKERCQGLFAARSVCEFAETFIGLCWVVECVLLYGLFPM